MNNMKLTEIQQKAIHYIEQRIAPVLMATTAGSKIEAPSPYSINTIQALEKKGKIRIQWRDGWTRIGVGLFGRQGSYKFRYQEAWVVLI